MKQDWDLFWQKENENRSFLSRIQSMYRTRIIAPAVDFYINRCFNKSGSYIECGSGKSETTLRTDKKKRRFTAVDYSLSVLMKIVDNPKIDNCVNGDIFSLPFRDGSINGIWNVGVMEHFSLEDIHRILLEFKRVLKSDGRILLFWPMAYAPYEILIRIVEFIMNRILNRPFQFYPDELSRLKSLKQGRGIIEKSRFDAIETYFNIRDLFSFGVVIGKK